MVATARQPEVLSDLIEKYGDNLRAVRQDVTRESKSSVAVSAAIRAFGRLDVVVNNAGYSRFGPFEQISDAEFKGIIDTCLYGVIYTTRAALPVMRQQRSGVIFQISSLGGRVTRPGNSPYHAAKWAVSGFSEALTQETASFGVQICCLEPGGIRTDWGKRASSRLPTVMTDYEESVGAALAGLQRYWGQEDCDPRRIADLIVRLSSQKDLPAHLLLGTNALMHYERVDSDRRASMSAWRLSSESVDFDESA